MRVGDAALIQLDLTLSVVIGHLYVYVCTAPYLPNGELVGGREGGLFAEPPDLLIFTIKCYEKQQTDLQEHVTSKPSQKSGKAEPRNAGDLTVIVDIYYKVLRVSQNLQGNVMSKPSPT